ncbi:2-isopropylmalate synthase [Heliophilum fasciatum]|uniref:2-isopropylmalate synthase n=1 Tax=Heliophilum fasciatum TaxID=35700 RepID=A0A4R2RYB6_9FIRM|nr:2-isopropylmalate synthase [Heliophilum fasciatum]MCW2277643.1 2-isopropylmalate synthase [Heliophilum fasciatum]TCP64991.1 2-isopropylmalate synthase [Heliophilum fasciatum]
MSQSKQVVIFDTTLRDGEQSPGVSLNLHDKIEIGMQLARLGVDVIEAGFPIASPGDFEAVKAVAEKVKGPIIAGLARANKKDIDRAAEALRAAEHARIHTFIATSDIHMRHKLRMEPDQVLEAAVEAVRYAKTFTSDVEFSAEDAFRSDVAFLCRLFEQVIRAGAKTINIPDTVGYATPQEYGQFIRDIINGTPNINEAIVSVHCHNDLGLAVANSLAALEAGARQLECTVNGIGERAGNASLEELVMALYTRYSIYGLDTKINKSEIYRSSRLVSNLTGMAVQANKAIVGKNAFAHESGIHQDGVLKERSTYEIMNPKMIGIFENNIVLGKHSGRHAFRERLKELGYELSDEEMQKAFLRFKMLADRKREITDADLAVLVDDERREEPEAFVLDYLQVTSGTTLMPTATVRLVSGDGSTNKVISASAHGDGPVDAVYKAIDQATGTSVKLTHYAIAAITPGEDAQGEVSVRVERDGCIYTGRGVDTDIITASAKAYLNGINKSINDNPPSRKPDRAI